MDPNTLAFLEKLEDFFSNPSFTTALRDFLSEHVESIEFKPIEEEQPLKNHHIYGQYTQMVERQLETFMGDEGLTPQEIYGAVEKAMSCGEASWLTCLDYLMASTEYEAFIELAYDHACMMGMGVAEEGEEWGEEDGVEEEEEEQPGAGQADVDGVTAAL